MLFDKEKMVSLLTNLNVLTGIRAALFDLKGQNLYVSGEGTEFCRLIRSTPEGRARCEGCDRNAIRDCREGGTLMFYRCHAGLCEAVQPIQMEGKTIAYLMFGEYLDNSDRCLQWENCQKQLEWYTGSRQELKEAFDQLDQYDTQKINAYLEIVEALKIYTYMSGIVFNFQYTDRQRLERYLEEHYMENLTLAVVSRDLNMGRTKLCALARSMPDGKTMSQLITQKRIREACRLLRQTSMSISEVSEAVGISDYNYFSKVFRSVTGVTPTAYRRTGLGK